MQTVLLIDDSPDIHDLVEARLRPEGLGLFHAFDAEQGFASAIEKQPDLILLDVDMPNVTGFEACRRLKTDPKTAHLPVIFLTGANHVYSKVEGFDLGAVDYVTKPFDAAELRARVRAALRTKRYHDLLSARAQLDALTGLWNRGYFNQRLTEELAAARRYGRKVSLILVDIDHFKMVNDQHGHPTGDRAIQLVGELLSAEVRTTDAPCRYGGEEFGIILPDTQSTDCMIVGERIRMGVRRLNVGTSSKPIQVTASLGIAGVDTLPVERITMEGLVSAADEALYRAKNTGRDRICIST